MICKGTPEFLPGTSPLQKWMGKWKERVCQVRSRPGQESPSPSFQEAAMKTTRKRVVLFCFLQAYPPGSCTRGKKLWQKMFGKIRGSKKAGECLFCKGTPEFLPGTSPLQKRMGKWKERVCQVRSRPGWERPSASTALSFSSGFACGENIPDCKKRRFCSACVCINGSRKDQNTSTVF